MPAYIAIQVDIQDPDAYELYKELAPASIAQYGGRYLVRGGRAETLEGEWRPTRFVLLEFPDRDTARAWWMSREYAEAKALRHAASESDMIVVEGVGEPAADESQA